MSYVAMDHCKYCGEEMRVVKCKNCTGTSYLKNLWKKQVCPHCMGRGIIKDCINEEYHAVDPEIVAVRKKEWMDMITGKRRPNS